MQEVVPGEKPDGSLPLTLIVSPPTIQRAAWTYPCTKILRLGSSSKWGENSLDLRHPPLPLLVSLPIMGTFLTLCYGWEGRLESNAGAGNGIAVSQFWTLLQMNFLPVPPPEFWNLDQKRAQPILIYPASATYCCCCCCCCTQALTPAS